MTARKVTLDDLKPREYEFEVIGPDDDTLIFTMRAPTQASMWEIERSMPLPDKNRFPNRQQPFIEAADGQVVPVLDEGAYRMALEDRLQTLMYRKILAAWVDAVEVLGSEDEKEQITALGQLEGWVISALWKMTQSLTTTSTNAIAARKFRGS